MSRRRWWRPGRPDELDADPWEGGRTPLAVLRDLQEARATGALEVRGGPWGAVHLEGGRILRVQSPSVPGLAVRVLRESTGGAPPGPRSPISPIGAEGQDAVTAATEAIARGALAPVRLAALAGDATADAATALFGGPETARVETDFAAGRRDWAPDAHTTDLDRLLAEVDRRLRVLTALAPVVAPTTRLSRAPSLPVPRARLSAEQWDVVRLADGRRGPREIAWRCGLGVFAVTVEAAALVRAGVLVADETPAGPRTSGRPDAPTTAGDVPASASGSPFLWAVAGDDTTAWEGAR